MHESLRPTLFFCVLYIESPKCKESVHGDSDSAEPSAKMVELVPEASCG